MCNKIFLDAPNIGGCERKYLNEALRTGYVSTIGPFVQKFEERFAAYLGATKAVTTQSGTAAIHMALYELGVGPGDEVIVPVLTFVAAVNPVVYVGAKPVFVDVDIETFTIDSKKIEEAITKRTKAIIPVHLYGNPCNMDKIMNIARQHNLYVIEDATESLGAKYRGKHTGTFGNLGCFSFNGNKTITTGGGGAVVGNNKRKLEHIKFLVNQARVESKGYYHSEIGFNYRMTNIEAALGLAQMERLDDTLSKKKTFHRLYADEVKDVSFIRLQKQHRYAEPLYWLTCIVFERKIDIVALQKKLKKRGIPTRRVFMPIIEFPPYRKYKHTDGENAYHLYERGLCLPSSTLNSEDDIYRVCGALKRLII